MISPLLFSTVTVTLSGPGGAPNDAPDASTTPSKVFDSPCIATAVTCAGFAVAAVVPLSRGDQATRTAVRPASTDVPTQRSTVWRAFVDGRSDNARRMSVGISAAAAWAFAFSTSATFGAQ